MFLFGDPLSFKRCQQQLQTGRAQIQAFTAEIDASQIALEGVREEANVGSRTVLDVLDADLFVVCQGNAPRQRLDFGSEFARTDV